jgi:hypothetical protein
MPKTEFPHYTAEQFRLLQQFLTPELLAFVKSHPERLAFVKEFSTRMRRDPAFMANVEATLTGPSAGLEAFTTMPLGELESFGWEVHPDLPSPKAAAAAVAAAVVPIAAGPGPAAAVVAV